MQMKQKKIKTKSIFQVPNLGLKSPYYLENSQFEDDEEEGDDLEAYAQKDYQEIPELDKYEEQDMDEESYSDLSDNARQQADQIVLQRQKEVHFLNADTRSRPTYSPGLLKRHL